MTWRRETVKARFLRKINRALGRCAHCTRYFVMVPERQQGIINRTSDDSLECAHS